MDKFFKVVGIIVVAWIALGLVGWLVAAVFKTVFFLALVAGVVYIVGAVANRRRIGGPMYRRNLR